MLAFAYNLIALFSALDCTFLHNTILAIIIFQTIKHIDNLPIELWKFIKKHKYSLISLAVLVLYLSISRSWYDFSEKFYFITINDIHKDILLTILYGFAMIFYSTKIDISGLTKHKKMLIIPLITIPIVFFIDYFTKFSIQEFIYIRKVGIDNLHIGMVYYTMLCCFAFSILYTKHQYLLSIITASLSFGMLLALTLIIKAGRITPAIFVLYLAVFFSHIAYHKITNRFCFDYHDRIYFAIFALLLISIIPLHLLTLKKDINFKNYGNRTIAHRQCIWNTTYTLYKELPQKLVGHGLNSYKAVNIMDNNTEKRLNCDRILTQIKHHSQNEITNTQQQDNNNKQLKNHINNKQNKTNNKAQKTITQTENNTNKIEFSKINSIALHPHSVILQILFEFGTIGLILFYIFMVLLVFEISKQSAQRQKQLAIKSAVIAGFVAVFFLFIFSHSLYTFWLWDLTIMIMFLLSATRNVIKEK